MAWKILIFDQVKRHVVYPWEEDQELGDRQGTRAGAIKKLVKSQTEQLHRDMLTFIGRHLQKSLQPVMLCHSTLTPQE